MDERINIDSISWIIKRLLSLIVRKFRTLVLIVIPSGIKKIGLKPGISFIIRAKNEEDNIKNCIMSIIDIADEIIFVDNQSTDKTLSIVQNLADKYTRIRVFEYKIKIPRCGDEQKHQVEIHSKNTIANYYNWCLAKATRYNIIKWDADCIANRSNLLKMVDTFHLHTRSDKFSLWFTGETLFVDSKNNYYINTKSFYDEFRCYSKLNGFHWVDIEKWEAPFGKYIESSVHERFDPPCFYEIKSVKKNELSSSRTGGKPLDSRDQMDQDILASLKKMNIQKTSLKKVPFSELSQNILTK